MNRKELHDKRVKIKRFLALVDIFAETGSLGHYDGNEWSIMLYDIKNHPKTIRSIRIMIETITTNYKLVILSPNEQYTNINILDIEL